MNAKSYIDSLKWDGGKPPNVWHYSAELNLGEQAELERLRHLCLVESLPLSARWIRLPAQSQSSNQTPAFWRQFAWQLLALRCKAHLKRRLTSFRESVLTLCRSWGFFL
jgi:hypothetical protein